MKIIVGSKNPVKLEATRRAFALYFGNATKIEVVGVSADSNVSEQPMDVHETAQGAMNRAQNICKTNPDVDYAIGIEGGLSFVTVNNIDYAFEQTWGAIVDCKTENSELGSGPAYPLPHKIVKLIKSGRTLTDAMADEYGTVDLGKNDGYNGWLSGNHIDRTEASKIAVFLALCALMKEK